MSMDVASTASGVCSAPAPTTLLQTATVTPVVLSTVSANNTINLWWTSKSSASGSVTASTASSSRVLLPPPTGLVPLQPHTVGHANHHLSLEMHLSDEEQRRRRDLLERRPSYRKILNELSDVEMKVKQEEPTHPHMPEHHSLSVLTGLSTRLQPHAVSTSGFTVPCPPGSVIQQQPPMFPSPTSQPQMMSATMVPHPHGSGDPHDHGSVSATLSNSLLSMPAMTVSTNHLLLPTQVLDRRSPDCSAASSSAKQSHHHLGLESPRGPSPNSDCSDNGDAPSPTESGTSLLSPPGGSSGLVPRDPFDSQHSSTSSLIDGVPPEGGGPIGGVTTKRAVRLRKNREAARECRRKKKEYVRCLENRVAVLERQNKQLIEELKTLKDLYCRKVEN